MQIGCLMHSDFIHTIVLKHPITPEKKLKADRMLLAAFDVSQTGLISLYDGAVVGLKDGSTWVMTKEARKQMKAMMQRQHEHGIRRLRSSRNLSNFSLHHRVRNLGECVSLEPFSVELHDLYLHCRARNRLLGRLEASVGK